MAFDRLGYVASPCRNCKSRKVGCHSHCRLYQAFKVENEQAKAESKKDSIYGFRTQSFIKSVV